jgi:hypothetical protein
MKRFIPVCFILVLSFSALHAQFKEGYIITNNNDTLVGYLNFEGSMINSNRCSFKSAPDSDAVTYYPGEIIGFRFNNSKFFITREIFRENELQKVFLEWLIKGKASILEYAGDLNPRYFILLENDSLYELENTKEIKNIDEIDYSVENKEYVGALRYYLQDAPSLSPRINTLSFDDKSFIKIAHDYHEQVCKDEACIIYEDTHRKINTSLGVAVNNFYSQLKLNNTKAENAYLASTFGFGISGEFSNLPILSPKFSLRLNAMYYHIIYSYSLEGLNYTYGDDERLFAIDFIRVPLQLTYKFSHSKLKPFVGLGLAANIRFGFTPYNQLLVNYITEHYDYSFGVTVLQLAVNGGLGLEYLVSKKIGFSFETDYEVAFGFFGTWINDLSWNWNLLFQLGAFYRFGER